MTPRSTEFEPIEPAAKKRRKRRTKKVRLPASLKQVNLDAAGIDIGASEHYVAVPEDREHLLRQKGSRLLGFVPRE